MGVFIDAQGKEHQLVIAERDLVVHDESLGFDRAIFAGQQVPGDLTEAYEQAVSGKAPRRPSPGKPKGDPKGEQPEAKSVQEARQSQADA